MKPNPEVQLQVRRAACEECAMGQGEETRCITGYGTLDADIMVVTKVPNSPKYQELLIDELERAGISSKRLFLTGALKCRNFDHSPSRADVKACHPYLEKEILLLEPKWILVLGNEALQSVVGKSGITKYRGQVFDLGDVKVMPTISPNAVVRNPGQRTGFTADIQYFAAQVRGESMTQDLPDHKVADTKAKLKELIADLKRADAMAFDVETQGFDEFKEGAGMVSLAVTLMGEGMTPHTMWAVPLKHPGSAWRRQWRRVLEVLAPHLSAVPRRVGHNGKFDCRWLRHHKVPIVETFDTMLAAHVLDENRAKGLKPLARMLFGADPWGIDTKDLASLPINEVLRYNALDTYWTFRLYEKFKDDFRKEPRLFRVFALLIMPANEIFVEAERYGVWIDPDRLATNYKIALDTLAGFHDELMQWVPDDHPGKVNFNASNFARWWLFDHLGLPVLKEGKTGPSMAEDVLLELRDEHPAVNIMLERVKWNKYVTSFLKPYSELTDERGRIHTTFKLHGTVTGRLSSGKIEADKVSGHAKIRGVNLQQVPRDVFIRGLIGAPDGWAFVEADFSQVELRVVAFLSRDTTMLRLYQTGQDIHRATASWVLGKPPGEVTKDDRKKAKAVNFGFVYGMGARKFVNTAFVKYGLRFSIEEAQKIRRSFFEQFAGLPAWHARQRRLAAEYRRVQSPLGRTRHLPDMASEDPGVRAEAERQAINSPVQSFASDLTLLSMVLLDKHFKKHNLPVHILGTVHDAINFEVREDALAEVLPIIRDTMGNLPLERKFGIRVDVPILADLKVGTHWGGARELTNDEIDHWGTKMVDWKNPR